ncbi:hypothetical protein ES706_02539 [subsurface metagenome]
MSVFKDLFKYLLVFSLALISLLCISTLAQATTYYVAENGNDSNPGTEAAPWASVDEAADTMVAGDTVYVKQGTYSGFALTTSGTANNMVNYLAYPGDTPIINGEIWFDNGASYNKIDGFILQNSSGGGIEMITGNKYNIISNNIIRDSASCGVDLSNNSEGNIIEYNEIYGHDDHGIHTSGSTKNEVFRGNVVYDNRLNGLGLAWGTGLQVINNIVYNNGKTGIEYTGEDIDGVIKGNLCYNNDVRHVGSSGGWEIFASGSNFVIEGNTAISRSGAPVTYFIEGSNHVVRNNIGYRSDGLSAGVVLFVNPADTDYNDWFDPLNPDPVRGTPGPHSISQDPLFVDMEKHDFHLQPDSPCIGAGENGVDMGAYGAGEPDPVYEDPAEPDPVYEDPAEPDSASENPTETDSPGDDVAGVLNQPNPFRAGRENTYIKYNLNQPSNVTITIYDLLGQEVWQENYRSGGNGGKEANTVPWDGRNLSGKVVANGGYICRIWVEKEKRHMLRKIAVAK